jgi:hypothetical protein
MVEISINRISQKDLMRMARFGGPFLFPLAFLLPEW